MKTINRTKAKELIKESKGKIFAATFENNKERRQPQTNERQT